MTTLQVFILLSPLSPYHPLDYSAYIYGFRGDRQGDRPLETAVTPRHRAVEAGLW